MPDLGQSYYLYCDSCLEYFSYVERQQAQYTPLNQAYDEKRLTSDKSWNPTKHGPMHLPCLIFSLQKLLARVPATATEPHGPYRQILPLFLRGHYITALFGIVLQQTVPTFANLAES